MKIQTLIKADFYINPENYGYYSHDDLSAIWREIIKPIISEIDYTKYIDNSSIHEWIVVYRRAFLELNG
jgi:hypothetical protein